MADNDDVPGTTPDPEVPAPERTSVILPPDPAAGAAPAAAATAPVTKPRWRDRVWSFGSVLALALAALVIGGVLGGMVVAVADDDDDDRGYFRMGPGGRGDRMPPGWSRPHPFRDGGPGWRWDDDSDSPDDDVTPDQSPSPSPSPSQ
jgi:hypothetical protein